MKRKTPLSRIVSLTAPKPGEGGQIASCAAASPPIPPGSTLARSHARTLFPFLVAALVVTATLLTLPTLHAQTVPDPVAAPALDPGVFQPFLDGLVGKYGWLTTVLLAIGSLRILFKPIMLVVENTVKNNPEKFAAIQKFEAGPIYKTIATVLDVGASIKLPLVKPPGPPAA